MMQLRNVGTFLWRTVYIQAGRRHYVYTGLEVLYVALMFLNGAQDEAPAPLNAGSDEQAADDVMMTDRLPISMVFWPNTSYNERLLRTMIADIKSRQQNSARACVKGRLSNDHAEADLEEPVPSSTKEVPTFLAVNKPRVLRTACFDQLQIMYNRSRFLADPLCVTFSPESETRLPNVSYTLLMPSDHRFIEDARQTTFPLGVDGTMNTTDQWLTELAVKFQYAINRAHVNLQHEAFQSQEKLLNMTIQEMPYWVFSGSSSTYRHKLFLGIFYAFLVPLVRRINAIEQEFSSGLAEYQGVMGLSEMEFFLGHLCTAMLFAMTECATAIAAMYSEDDEGRSQAYDIDPSLLVTSFAIFHTGHTLMVTMFAWIFPKGWMGLTIGVLVYMTAQSSATKPPSVAGYILQPREEKLAASVFPVDGFVSVLRILLLARDFEGSAGWSIVNRRVLDRDNVTIAEIWAGMLCSDLVMLFLTWYLSRVLPWASESPLSPFFLFMPSYWKPESTNIAPAKPQSRQADRFEELSGDVSEIVVAQNLTKVYGDKRALNVVDLRVYESRVTALLGQNGAGKTTLLNILTGIQSATSGLVKVCQLNVATQRDEVRKMVSLCQQTNIFFQDLTCFEHLVYFGSLRCLNRDELFENVNSAITTVQLTERANSMPGELSGGTIRRLSIAIALLWKPKLLILDEPTAGLEAETRRNVWTAVSRAAKNRTVLFSTHNMAEAEAIAEQIIIMAQGKAVCSGSKTFLMKACGSGYKLNILKSPKAFNLKSVLSAVRKAVPSADVDDETLDEVSIALRTLEHKDLSAVFETLEETAPKLGIASMGVTAASLMDVYIKIITDWVPGGKRKGGAVEDEHMARMCIPIKKEPTFRRSFHALFVKRFLSLRRSWRQLTATFVAPFLSLLVIMSVVGSPEDKLRQEGQASFDERYASTGLLQVKLGFNEQFPGALVFLQEPRPPTSNASHHFKVLVESDGGSIRLVQHIRSVLWKIAAEDFSLYMRTYPMAVAYEEGVVRGMYNPTSFAARPVLLNLLHEAQLRASTGHAEARIHSTLVFPEAAKPGLAERLIWHMGIVWYWASFPAISYTLAVASFVVYPAAERLSGARQMQLMTGISGSAFILSHFVFDVACYALQMAAWCLVHFTFSSYPISTAIYFYLAFLSFAPAAISYAYLAAERAQSTGGGIASVIQWVYVNGLISLLATASSGYNSLILLTLFPPLGIATSLAKISTFDVVTQHCGHDTQFALKDKSESTNDNRCDASTPFSFGDGGIGYEISYSFFQAAFFFTWASLLTSGFIFEWSSTPPEISEERVADQDVEDENKLVTELRNKRKFSAHSLVAWNLHKLYDTQHAVRGVYLALRPRECFGFLGANGAGKTTTFQMLAGLTTVSYGEAYTTSGALNKKPREIGYCSQAEGLLDKLNSYEHLSLIGRLRGIPEQEKNLMVGSMLSVLDLEETATEECGLYSGGTRRKLYTGMALLGLPPIIFLDEPFSGVDTVSRSRIVRGIGVIKKKTQTSFVLTSHETEECESACDRISIMVAGRMMCLGTLQQLKDKYGRGQRIEFLLDQADDEKLCVFTQAVTEQFPGIRLATVNEGIFTFRLAERVPLSVLFRKVVQLEEDFALKNAIVGDYTLEQILIAFASAAHHPDRPVQAVPSLVSTAVTTTGTAADIYKPKK